VAQMMAGLKSVFYVRAYNSLVNHPEVKLLASLAKAYESNVTRVFQKSFKTLQPKLTNDPLIGPYLNLLCALEPKIDLTDENAVIYRRVVPEEAEGQECPICLDPFGDPFDPKSVGLDEGGYARAVRLFRCSEHYFHQHCVKPWIDKHQNCPVCGMYYGRGIGFMPEGEMTVTKETSSLPGHGKVGTIMIQFNFPSGAQGEDAPSPNSPYSAAKIDGFLPNSTEGQKVLELFRIGWERKQLFRIDENGNIGDGGISIKTQREGGIHGYPDASYLERVVQELQSKGIGQ